MLKIWQHARARSGSRSGQEDGFILLAVLFLVALLLIGMAVAAPQIARSIQRDKDMELVHRGEQYKRAIKLYYRKFGTYPTSIDQLVETNNIRFLRKRYKDPITGLDDWRLIHLGQAKVPPMGLFGQPLAGLPGPPVAGGGLTAGAPNAASATGASPFGSVTVDTPDNSNSDNSSDSGDDSGSVENAETHPSVTITGAAPTPTPSPGTTAPATPGASTSAFGGSAGTGQAFGGGPIVGVGIPITKPSLIVYKKQKRYSKWEFVYNPLEDQMQAAGFAGVGGTTGGTSAGQPTGGINMPNTGMGNSNSTGTNDAQPGASAQMQ